MRELKESGTFRDDNQQDWEIGVYHYEDGGKTRYDTVVQGPDGQQYKPEEDFLGEFHLIDRNGKAHAAELPMNMAALQDAVEKVEDVAWGRKSPLDMKREGTLTVGERDKWEKLVKDFDKEPEPAAAKADKPNWRERLAQLRDKPAAERGR